MNVHNVKRVTCRDKEISNFAVSLSSTDPFSIFQHIVLLLWSTGVLF